MVYKIIQFILGVLVGEKCPCCQMNRLRTAYTRFHMIHYCPICTYKKVVKK